MIASETIRAAAYCRDSGGVDQDLSVDQQVENIAQFCKDQNYALTKVFKDIAKSGGKVAGRNQFIEMIRYMESAPEKVLIFWSYSRFARDWDASMFYLARLRQCGVTVLSVSDPVPDTLDGRIMEALTSWQHAKFRETLSKDVVRGQAYVMSAYKAVVSRISVGYKTVPIQVGVRRDGSPHILHQLVVDPEIGPIVQKAWQMRAEGYSYKEIHDVCNLFPIRTSYSGLFRNKIYLGIMVRGGRQYEGYAPPLIDVETWQKVQILNQANDKKGGNHPRRQSSSYLLSGVIHCQRCGKTLSGWSTKKPYGRRLRYYVCIGRNELNDPCRQHRFSEHKLDQWVLVRIKELFTNGENLRKLYEQGREAAQVLGKKSKTDESLIRKNLKDIERKIKRLVSAIESAGHSQALIDQLGKLEHERNLLHFRLSDLAIERPKIEVPDIADLQKFGLAAWMEFERAEKRKQQLLIRDLIKRIEIDYVNGQIVGEIKLKGIPGIGETDTVMSL